MEVDDNGGGGGAGGLTGGTNLPILEAGGNLTINWSVITSIDLSRIIYVT